MSITASIPSLPPLFPERDTVAQGGFVRLDEKKTVSLSASCVEYCMKYCLE